MILALPLLAAGFLAQGALHTTPPSDLTLPPETAQLVTILEGRGVQIYTCTAQPDGFHWVLSAPEAKLYNLATGKQQGRHDAGPSWTLDDGSAIRGTVETRKPADAATDIPWVLLKTDGLSSTQGTLTPVSFVRRYNTHGGVAPATGCDAAHANGTTRVPYTATYAFYSTSPVSPLLQTAPAAMPPQ